jgi:hypothetical protein
MNSNYRLMMIAVFIAYATMQGFNTEFIPYSLAELSTMHVKLPIHDKKEKFMTDYAVNVIGNKAYDSQEKAQEDGILFDKANKFKKGDLVIVPENGNLIFGIILQAASTDTYIVQLNTQGTAYKLDIKADQLGKIPLP